jgi:hypothetical protein
MFSSNQTGMKNCVRVCVIYHLKTGSIILVAVIAHPAPTLAIWNSSLWINVDIYADQCLLC